MSQNHALPWKQIANTWKLLTPPWRPSRVNLRDYKEFLQKTIGGVKNPKVLILGATPEIRDLLSKFKNIEVTLVDYNMEMILAMNELVKKDNTKNEIWVKSDWLNVPLKEKYFDAVIGDYITTNIHAKNLNQLLKKINVLLKPNGRFISRILYYNPNEALIDFEKIVNKYKIFPINNQIVTDFASDLFVNSIVIKKKRYYVFSMFLIKKLRDKYKKDNKDIKLLKALDKIFFPYTKEWFFYDLKNTEKALSEYFILEDRAVEPANSTFANNTFIYYLKPKKYAKKTMG